MPGAPSQFQLSPNRYHGSWTFFITDITGGTGDILTDFIPGFPGHIVRTWLVVVTLVTSAGTANVTFNLEIGSLNVAGGDVTISTNAAAGTFIAGTAVTGSNAFDNNDTLSLELTESVAPTAGQVNFVVEYEGKITQG